MGQTENQQQSDKPAMAPTQFRAYQLELGLTHAATASLLGASEVGIKRFAIGARPIPGYIAQSLRAMVLLHRSGKLKKLDELD